MEIALTIALANSGRKWIGEVAHVAMLYEQLEALGHRPWIVCRRGKALHERATDRGWRVLPLHFSPRFNPRLDIADYSAWCDWARREKADLLHCHRGADHWRAVFVARRLGLPVVRTRHVVIPVKRHWMNRWLYMKATDAVLCVSRATRNSFGPWQDELPMGAPVILSAIDSKKFNPGRRSEGWRRELGGEGSGNQVWFGLIGRFQRVKGQRIFLDACLRVARETPEARFLLAMPGYEVDREAMRRRAAKLGIADRVKVIGHVDDLPMAMASLDVGVIASTGSEGSSRVGMELMASGLPVLATRVGGIPDLMEPSGGCRLVEPKSSLALAEGMLGWIKDRNQWPAAGEKNREHVVEQHHPRKWAGAIFTIYQQVLAKHRRID